MKKRIILFLLICLSCSIMGCNGSVENSEGTEATGKDSQTEVSSSEEVVEMREVVFCNFISGSLIEDGYPEVNTIKLEKYFDDENTLYACRVYIRNAINWLEPLARIEGESDRAYQIRTEMYEAEYVAKLLSEQGLMVLQDYPFCYYSNDMLYELNDDKEAYEKKLILGECVVVGTYEQLMTVFNGTDKMDKCWFSVSIASRPDLMEALAECGYAYDADSGMREEGWVASYSNQLIEIEGSEYCTLTVPVIMPEETTDTK